MTLGPDSPLVAEEQAIFCSYLPSLPISLPSLPILLFLSYFLFHSTFSPFLSSVSLSPYTACQSTSLFFSILSPSFFLFISPPPSSLILLLSLLSILASSSPFLPSLFCFSPRMLLPQSCSASIISSQHCQTCHKKRN